MERTSKRDHEYGGKQLKAGDKFEVEDEKHIPILLAFGRIEPLEGELGYVAAGDQQPQPSVKPQRRKLGLPR